MFAFAVITLLILIAIGVLLMSEGGKAILNGISMLAVIGIVLFVLFWLVVLGYAFFNSSTGSAFMGALGTGIGFILLFIGCIVFVWMTVRFFRELFTEKPRIFTWKERRGMYGRLRQFSAKHLNTIVGTTLLWFVALMFFGILPDNWQTPALVILGWPLLIMLAILITFLLLGRSKKHSTAGKQSA